MPAYAFARTNPEDETALKIALCGCIRQIRVREDITQTELAKRVGVPSSHISNICRGRPHHISCERIAMMIDQLGYSLTISVTKSRQKIIDR